MQKCKCKKISLTLNINNFKLKSHKVSEQIIHILEDTVTVIFEVHK